MTTPRNDLKGYFTTNAIPTAGQFAELIDAALNQADDGVFKEKDQPLGILAAATPQKPVLKLYAEFKSSETSSPDWMICLNAKDPKDSKKNVAGLGIVNKAGETKLMIGADGSLFLRGRMHADSLRIGNDLIIANGNISGANDVAAASATLGPVTISGVAGLRVGEPGMTITSRLGLVVLGPVNADAVTVGGLTIKDSDVVLNGGVSLRGRDNSLWLNPDDAFSLGVRSRGHFGCNALNVSGSDSSVCPGSGNASIGGTLTASVIQTMVGGVTIEGNTIVVGGDVVLNGGVSLRGGDNSLWLNPDAAFSQGVRARGHFGCSALNVSAVDSSVCPSDGNALIGGTLTASVIQTMVGGVTLEGNTIRGASNLSATSGTIGGIKMENGAITGATSATFGNGTFSNGRNDSEALVIKIASGGLAIYWIFGANGSLKREIWGVDPIIPPDTRTVTLA